MTKSRTHNEIEHMRGQIKALEAENRHLKKMIKQLERHQHMYESQDEEVDDGTDDTVRPDCDDCGKGVMYVMDLGKFQYKMCPICNHRKRLDGQS